MKSVFNWCSSSLSLISLFIFSQFELSYCQSGIPADQLPAPVISLSSIGDTLCATPGDLGIYQWYHCDETKILGRSSCLLIETSGCYCVEGKNALGRTSETCTEFFITGTAPLFRDAIHITPNPTYGNFHIVLSHHSFLPVQWILLDFTGKEIETGWMREKSEDLDFSDQKLGIYLIKFFSGKNDMEMKRIIIAE